MISILVRIAQSLAPPCTADASASSGRHSASLSRTVLTSAAPARFAAIPRCEPDAPGSAARGAGAPVGTLSGRCLSDRPLSGVESADAVSVDVACVGVRSAMPRGPAGLDAAAVGEGGGDEEVWDTSMSGLGARSFGWRGEPARQ